jgi:hypothetical protein
MLNQPFSFFRARCYLFIFALAVFFPAALPAQQYLSVDCTGASPWAYPSINAALPNATPGAFIFVTGPCTENVSLNDVSQLNLGSYSGQPATLNGSISIFNSENVSLYGLNVTNASGDGVSVYNSRGISLNISSSSGNAGVGLVVGGMSDVSIYAYGAFDHNGRGGINIGGNSMVTASQAYFLGINQVIGNGTLADPRSAGIRVDGNSEAFFRGGQVAQNNGPGILALVNSSVDFTGATFTGNAGGEIIDCDSSSWMISDLALPNRVPPAGVVCRTPHGLGNRTISKTEPLIPDWTAQKVRLNKYLAVAIKH